MDNDRLEQIEKSIEEIKQGQSIISQALLGDFSRNGIGLIEETRNLRRELDEIKGQGRIHSAQIEEVIQFKSDTKKIVGAIAMIVPLAFELFKMGLGTLWDILSKTK